MVRGEHVSLKPRVSIDFTVHVEHLLRPVLRVLLEEILMPGKYVLHQAVLVPGPVRTESALELRIDAALEIVVSLQMMLVLVRFTAGDAGVLKHSAARILGLG